MLKRFFHLNFSLWFPIIFVWFYKTNHPWDVFYFSQLLLHCCEYFCSSINHSTWFCFSGTTLTTTITMASGVLTFSFSRIPQQIFTWSKTGTQISPMHLMWARSILIFPVIQIHYIPILQFRLLQPGLVWRSRDHLHDRSFPAMDHDSIWQCIYKWFPGSHTRKLFCTNRCQCWKYYECHSRYLLGYSNCWYFPDSLCSKWYNKLSLQRHQRKRKLIVSTLTGLLPEQTILLRWQHAVQEYQAPILFLSLSLLISLRWIALFLASSMFPISQYHRWFQLDSIHSRGYIPCSLFRRWNNKLLYIDADGSNGSLVSLSNLNPGMTYQIQVSSICSGTSSGYSVPFIFTTDVTPVPCIRPYGLTNPALTNNTAQIDWTPYVTADTFRDLLHWIGKRKLPLCGIVRSTRKFLHNHRTESPRRLTAYRWVQFAMDPESDIVRPFNSPLTQLR